VISPQQAHLKPTPTPDADSEQLWKGLKEGKLFLQHCEDCGHIQYYHQAICRHCLGENLVDWLKKRLAAKVLFIHTVWFTGHRALRSRTRYLMPSFWLSWKKVHA